MRAQGTVYLQWFTSVLTQFKCFLRDEPLTFKGGEGRLASILVPKEIECTLPLLKNFMHHSKQKISMLHRKKYHAYIFPQGAHTSSVNSLFMFEI